MDPPHTWNILRHQKIRTVDLNWSVPQITKIGVPWYDCVHDHTSGTKKEREFSIHFSRLVQQFSVGLLKTKAGFKIRVRSQVMVTNDMGPQCRRYSLPRSHIKRIFGLEDVLTILKKWIFHDWPTRQYLHFQNA